VSFDPGERSMGAMAHLAGADNLIWASDFPHSDAKYPGVVDELREHTDDMDAADRAKLFGENAARLYGIEDLVATRTSS
jgi:predicted TIM-barrel fold metal-dependent hydrolase